MDLSSIWVAKLLILAFHVCECHRECHHPKPLEHLSFLSTKVGKIVYRLAIFPLPCLILTVHVPVNDIWARGSHYTTLLESKKSHIIDITLAGVLIDSRLDTYRLTHQQAVASR